MAATKTKWILSLRGGGIRGIIPARVLAALEARLQRPCHELFDLFAGTSTGGIIALALTRPDPLSATDVEQLYIQRGANIFSRTREHELATLDGLTGPRYTADGIEQVLRETFPISRTESARTGLVADAIKPVCVTMYDTTGREPMLLTSADADSILTWQAARATSAAPTYFPPFLLPAIGGPGTLQLVDGGVCANDPSSLALGWAVRMGWSLDDVRLLTLGTGDTNKPLAFAAEWGLAQWARPLIDILLDGNAEVAFEAAQLMLGDRATLLDAPLPRDLEAMDDVSAENMKALQIVADGIIASAAFEKIVGELRDVLV